MHLGDRQQDKHDRLHNGYSETFEFGRPDARRVGSAKGESIGHAKRVAV